MWRQVEITDRLLARRQARSRAASLRGSHPIAHVDPDKAHEWMRIECASLDAARQAREDKLMEVVIQTSSAALLAIPGLLVASGKELPKVSGSWLFYFALAAFALSFGGAFLEQVLSGKAYKAQRTLAVTYFTKSSEKNFDEKAARRADLARSATLIIFGIAVIVGALGLFQIARGSNARAAASTAAPAASTAAPAAPAAASTAASTAAPTTAPTAAISARRRNLGSKVEPRPHRSTAAEAR